MKHILLLFLILKVLASKAQTADTAFYFNKKILMITIDVNEKDSVIAIVDENNRNLIYQGTLEYKFFDAKFNKKRIIKIVNNVLMEDYFVSESDTIYSYFQYDKNFKTKLNQFYNYLEQNVTYPTNALKKGIQAQVKISCVIDEKGAITQIVPLTKHEWGFEESLMRTLKDKKQYGFIMYKDKPVKLYMEIPFAFVIKKK